MKEHDLKTDENDPDIARCTGCGMTVRYHRGHRSEHLDRKAVRRSAMKYAGLRTSRRKNARDAMDCDLVLKAVLQKVMED